MDTFLTFTVLGLVLSAVYAIAASGLVLTYNTSGIFNFAHGAQAMLGAFMYWQFSVGWGLPQWLALVLTLGAGSITTVGTCSSAPRSFWSPQSRSWPSTS